MNNILPSIWQALVHTPWWVYLLLAYLIKIDIQASKTRVASLKKLFILPTILLLMSIHTLITSFPINPFTLTIYIISILLGIALGFWQIYRLKIKIDKKHMLIQLPGTWSTLIVVLIVFAAKYFFGYELAVDPNLVKQTDFEIIMLGISGILTGLFVGRVICYLYRYATYPSVNLREN